MKKLFYFIAVLTGTMASAQPQNLNFETWTSFISPDDMFRASPNNWVCYNRWYGAEQAEESATYYMPMAEPQNGNYALRLMTWYNYLKDSAVQTAPISNGPAQLTGHYKYEENLIFNGTQTIVDTALVVVVLTKWNAATSVNETIGRGVFSTHTMTSVYQDFEVNIEYFSAATPDSITILLDPSIIGRDPESNFINLSGGGNSIFTVDNLALVGQALGTGDVARPSVTLYPNPVTDILRFDGITGKVSVYDVAGEKIQQAMMVNDGAIDVSPLASGTYLLNIEGEGYIHHEKFIKK